MSFVGLLLFVVVIVIDAFALMADGVVQLRGGRTLTADVREMPELGCGIVVIQLLAVVGLCLHFWG